MPGYQPIRVPFGHPNHAQCKYNLEVCRCISFYLLHSPKWLESWLWKEPRPGCNSFSLRNTCWVFAAVTLQGLLILLSTPPGWLLCNCSFLSMLLNIKGLGFKGNCCVCFALLQQTYCVHSAPYSIPLPSEGCVIMFDLWAVHTKCIWGEVLSAGMVCSCWWVLVSIGHSVPLPLYQYLRWAVEYVQVNRADCWEFALSSLGYLTHLVYYWTHFSVGCCWLRDDILPFCQDSPCPNELHVNIYCP